MPTYIKTTNFLAKDSLPLNNAAKYVKGSEIDTEFDNIETADTDNMKKSAMGTGVENALLVNVGSAGAFSTAVAASQSDQETRTSTTVYVSPGRQQYHPSAAKVCCFCGITGNIVYNYNMSSVTDTGTGVATMVFDVDFSSTSYVALAMIDSSNAYFAHANSNSAGSIVIECRDAGGTNQDPTGYWFAGLGDQ